MRVVVGLAIAAASSVALARTPPPADVPSTIQVTGTARISETPDRVYVDIGVATEAPTSQAASSKNAERLRAVIAAIRRSAGPTAQLTTAQYSVSPEYRYSREGAAPKIVGYAVSNVVQVRLDDLERIGRVIDGADQAGANRVEAIRFTLRNAETARMEALRKAALNAREDANALAGALSLRIVRTLSVDERSPVIVPVRPIFARAMTETTAQAATPVESGTLDVTASVRLTVEVAPVGR
jgi:uncharacterized protein